MRLSEIGSKEIIDLSKGCKHGQLWDAEMMFEKKDGKIRAVLVPGEVAKGLFKSSGEQWLQLPLDNIVKIGEDMIIFESDRMD